MAAWLGQPTRRHAIHASVACLTLSAVPQGAIALPSQSSGSVVTISAVAANQAVHAGDQIPVAIVLNHGAGFHTWPHNPVVPGGLGAVIPIPTSITPVRVPPRTVIGEVEWPRLTTVTVNYAGTPVKLLSYADSAVAYVPVSLPPQLPVGPALLAFAVRFQACNDRICLFPETDTVTVRLAVLATGSAATQSDPPSHVFRGFDPTVFGRHSASPMDEASHRFTTNAFGWSINFDATGPMGMALLIAAAAVGGLLLNATPCVLPLVPIKMLSLARTGEPGRLRLHGLALSAGVVLFWVALGGAIAFASGLRSISDLFQLGWFGLVVGGVVALLALATLADLSLRLPHVVTRINPTGDTIGGSLTLGILTAVLSTPCTAPFMGAAAAFAVTQRPATTMSVFGAIGIGMALPYATLALRPGWLRRVPRSGPASVLVKQVMGILLFAVAAFFIGSSWPGRWRTSGTPGHDYWWAVGGFVVLAVSWGVWRSNALVHRPARRALITAVGLSMVGLTGLATRALTRADAVAWREYTPAAFAAARGRGDVVVMDFTAEWCLNCKALEAGVLDRPEIATRLNAPGVTALRVDLTGDNPAGRAKLSQLRWVGIPLLAIYGPRTGYDSPVRYDSYTPPMVRSALQAAGARAEH